MAEINNFIKTIMQQDLESKKVDEIITRFPPEPNAYLHIGHARAIITNFELAKAFNGSTNLRFDDTNPAKEDKEFVDGIIYDLAWLGYKPKNVFYGSDYFEKTYEKASTTDCCGSPSVTAANSLRRRKFFSCTGD